MERIVTEPTDISSTVLDAINKKLNGLDDIKEKLEMLDNRLKRVESRNSELQYSVDNFNSRLKAFEQFPRELLSSQGRPSTYRSYPVGSSVSGTSEFVQTGFSR
jgi:hypothetical protein